MDHEAHVRLVDAHAKGNRRHHDLHIITDEGFLISLALGIIQPRVIWPNRILVTRQSRGELIHLLSIEGLPREVLIVTPGVWDGERLLAAPSAGLSAGWQARLQHPFTFSR